MIILYPILIFLSKTVNGKFSLLQMFPPPKFSSPSLDLHNLRFLTPNFFSPAFFSHPTSFSPGISFKNFFPSKFLSPERFCHCRSPSLLIFSLPHSSLIQPPPFPKSPPTSHLQKVFLPQKFPPSEKALSPQIPLPDNFFSPVIPFLSANRVSFLLSFFPSFLLSFFPSFLSPSFLFPSLLLSSSPAFPAPPFSLFRQTKSRRFSPTAFLLSAFLLPRLIQPAVAQPRGFRFQHFQPVRQPLRARPEFPCRSAQQPVSGYAARYRYRPESDGRR